MRLTPVVVAAQVLLFSDVCAAPLVQLNIDAQPMSEALREFVRQSGVQVLFPASDRLNGLTSGQVTGEITPKIAIDRLLEGTGLKGELINANTVAILQVARSQKANAVISSDSAELRAGADVEKKTANDAVEAGDRPAPIDTVSEVGAGVPQVLVKGSRSLNADIERTQDDVRPYVVISKKQIERSGATTVDELLRSQLTMSYVAQPTNVSTNVGKAVGNFSSVALRGLGPNETLILIDGRRVTTSRSQLDEFQTNLNSIPLSSIERIEVLPATASGIYGGNATGGVVNVVLRRDYTGLESTLTYGNTFASGGGTRSLSIYGAMPFDGDRGSLSLGLNHSISSRLLLEDRAFIADRQRKKYDTARASDATAFYNSGDPPLGATTNISSVPSVDFPYFLQTRTVRLVAPNLTLKSGGSLNSPITFLPPGYQNTAADKAALISNAGAYNVSLPNSDAFGGSNSSLIGAPTVSSADVTLRFAINPSVDLFSEISVARNEQYYYGSYLSGRFTIPSTAPTNPFNQDILVSAPIGHEGFVTRTQADDRRFLLGTDIRIGQEWSGAIDTSLSTSLLHQVSPPNNFSPSAAAGVASGAINLMQDSSGYTQQLLQGPLPSSVVSPTKSRLNSTAIRLAGPVAEYSAGKAVLSFLIENQHQYYGEFSSSVDPSFVAHFSDAASTTNSVYSELRIPLASDTSPLLGIRVAELQFAGRYGDYALRATRSLNTSQVGVSPSHRSFSSVDPSVGLRFEPIRGLSVRASFGTGLRPPYLGQLQSQQSTKLNAGLFRLTDPKRAGEPLGTINFQSGGNADLVPEESTSRSAGLVFAPVSIEGLRISFDWTSIKKRDNITTVGIGQQAINDEDTLPGVITRSAPVAGDPFGIGKISGFDQRFRNAARAQSDSYDLSLNYSLSTESGQRWTFSNTATRLLRNSLQISSGSAVTEQAGTVISPAWSANSSLQWEYDGWLVGWASKFFDSYRLRTDGAFVVLQGSNHVPSETYHDFILAYDFGTSPSVGGRYLPGVKVQLSVQNVFDTLPRYNVLGVYLSDTWVDARGATYSLSFKKSFLN